MASTICVSLIVLAILLGIIGSFLLLKAFFANKEKSLEKKAVFLGWMGVILLFGMGLIFIFFYSLQPVPERIIEDYREKSKESLPDLSFQKIYWKD